MKITKKDQEELCREHIIIEKIPGKNGKYDTYNVHMHLSAGKLLTLHSTIQTYYEAGSSLAGDLLTFFNNALSRSGINLDKI